MIYFDNAATTLPKPPEVKEAVCRALDIMGNADRGVHDASLGTMRTIYHARELAAELFGVSSPSRVAFAKNATEALNTAIRGLLAPGDHVIATAAEHNSVLRPLYELERRGVGLSILPCDERGYVRMELLGEFLRPNTRAVVCTHASNVTGNVMDVRRAGRFCRERGLLFILDASQTAGVCPVKMEETGADVICFTGHKGLYGPQGTGGLCVREGVEIAPLLFGGSGIQSYLKTQPSGMPGRLEAGTQNGHGLAGLAAGMEFVLRTGIRRIGEREQTLARRFYEGIRSIPGIRVYGDVQAPDHTGVVSFNLEGWDSGETADELARRFSIACRPGAHCAPLMHEALGTREQGTVRFSFSWFNTEEEIEEGIRAVVCLAEE